jgi:hypothetical protein
MRRLLISLFAIAAFLGCNKDDYPNDVIRTLASAGGVWQEYETFVYSEPNGEGEIRSHIDPKEPPLLGHNYEKFTIENGMLTRYIGVNSVGAFYYKEYVMKQVGDDPLNYKLITPDGEFYFKILEYDSDNLKVEYNFVQVNSADKVNGEYVKKCTYRITHFKKHIPSDSKWKDMYMTEKEYLEYLEKYW